MNKNDPLRKKTVDKDKIKKTYDTYQFSQTQIGNAPGNEFDVSMKTNKRQTQA